MSIDEKVILQSLIESVKNGDIKLEDVPAKYKQKVEESL